MPLRPLSRGLSRYRREPVRGSDAKLGLPWDAYYVLTKAEARLTNSKIHPNTGSPDYNITHDHTTDFTNVGTNTHAQLDTHKSSDGTDHSGVNGVVTIHSDVTDAGSGLIITETERTDLNTALIHVGSDGTDHTFIDQDVRTSAGPSFDELTITSPTQDFKFLQPTAINGSIAWQGQTSGTATRFGFFSKDGDGTDHVIFDIYGVGVPDDFTGLENMVIGYLNSGVFIVRSSTNEIQLRSGSGADHIKLKLDKTTEFPAGDVDVTGGDLLVFDDNLVLPKTTGKGIKIDTTTPTFGWRDLLGETTTRSTGANKPSFEAYNGEINQYRFSAGEHEHYDFHIPHDYVAGTDIHLHIHWSQISTTNTGGTVDFKYSAAYSKGHNQAAFTTTPITATFTSADAGTVRYRQHITETIISGASATSALFDRDDLEPDGVILMTLEMAANDLTDSVGVTDPFIHYVDIHYQSTNISTKDKVPDFYA